MPMWQTMSQGGHYPALNLAELGGRSLAAGDFILARPYDAPFTHQTFAFVAEPGHPLLLPASICQLSADEVHKEA